MLLAIQILQVIKAAWEAFPIIEKLWKRFHEFFTMFLAMMVFWAGMNVVRERDVWKGLQAAFIASSADVHANELSARAPVMQIELNRVTESNQVIKRILQAVLGTTKGAARTRVGLIHNGVYGITGMSLLHFDITHAVAAPGRSEGEYTQNAPLSQWDDYLSIMVKGECAYIHSDAMKSSAARARLEAIGIVAFTACPIVDSRNQILGGLFVSWDKNDPAPADADVTQLLKEHLRAATQIAGAMELRR